MLHGWCCIANRHIGARERRQLIPHVRFQVPFLGPESQLKSGFACAGLLYTHLQTHVDDVLSSFTNKLLARVGGRVAIGPMIFLHIAGEVGFLGDTKSRRELLVFAQANPSRLPLAMGIAVKHPEMATLVGPF